MMLPRFPSSLHCELPIGIRHWIIAAVAGLYLLLPAVSTGQSAALPSPETGWYFTQNFGTRDYEAHAQNWAVVQDSTGLIYVGNGSGLLEYDGVTWRLIELPTRSAVRSLAVGPDGTVYVGGQGDFGYLTAGAAGTRQYVSLLPNVDADHTDFSVVWRTIATSDGIYFSSRERLFRWSPPGGASSDGAFSGESSRDGSPSDGSAHNGMTSWAPDAIFALGFVFQDTFYTVEPGKGLLQVEGDTLHPAPGGDALRQDIVDFALPRDDGTVLLATRKQGLVRYDGRAITPFETEVDDALQRDQLYHGTRLPNGTLALATRRGGLYLVSHTGRLLRVVDEDTGLSDPHIWYAYLDREGSLWLALNSGIARVDVSSPLTFFDEAAGLPGIVMSVVRHDGRLFAATSTGVYRLASTTGRAPRFEPMLPNTSGQCLTLISTDAGLLAGCEGGLYAPESGASDRLTDITTRLLYQSTQRPNRAYAATREGLMRLALRDGRWQPGEILPGLPGWALSITEDHAGALWITTGEGEVVRVVGADDAAPSITRFTSEHGLPPGWSYAALIDSTLLFHTTEGIYQLDDANVPARFVPDPLIGAHLPDPHNEVFLLEEDDAGQVWFSNERTIGVARPQSDGSYRPTTNRTQRLPDISVQTIYPEADSTIWFATEDGLLRYATAEADTVDADTANAGAVQIRRVATIDGDSLLFGGAGPPPAEVHLPYTQNALRFAFALPSYDATEAHRYQVRLDGLDATWSAWSTETVRDYTNVPAGRYVFRVRARDAYGRLRPEGTFAFRIAPPWYQTGWAYLLFGLAALGLVGGAAYGGFRYRVRRLEAQNERLEQQVQRRTQTLKTANKQLEQVLAQNNEFLSIAAHDLKNPLTNVIGFCDILLDEEEKTKKANDERAEFLSLIRTSALRMHGIVRQLQDTALLDAGQINLHPEPTDLSELAAAALQRHEVQAREKSIPLHLAADEPVYAPADAPYIARALDNLISNAIKFSPAGANVWVRLHVDGDQAVIAVEDEGPGLSTADQARAFKKLQRLSPQPTAGEASTGLGLYIVRTLIEQHGGTVHVESEPGAGATFIIRLAATTA